MRFGANLLAVCFALAGVHALEDGCPKDDYACLDVMNSSQCIAQLILDNRAPGPTKEALIACVETEGTATTIPGAQKYCRCPGCHSAPINKVISELFPPPCA